MHFQRGEVAEPEVTVTTDYATPLDPVDQDPQRDASVHGGQDPSAGQPDEAHGLAARSGPG